jgi:4-amino-4-deoxy-L-arabinose transferase-like glycosyltransferase
MVAPIIIETGEPAVAIGGFMGGDPILTANEFAQKVKDGQIRSMLLSAPPERPLLGGGPGQAPGGTAGRFGGGFGFGRIGGAQADIAKWVRENGKPVDPALWKPAVTPAETAAQTAPAGAPGFFGGRRGGMANLRLYDLRPDKEAKTVPKS